MPSWPSTMNSCGSTCRIFWSAGMATALAASMTCSTSPCVTSLSRTPTTPCELRLRTWLPAMPANTEWISQPAMSSASSTARWMDCTVDSMLTTTPFFRPREGCEPKPEELDRTVGADLPDQRHDLGGADIEADDEIAFRALKHRVSRSRRVAGVAAPADGKAVGVAHVHVGDVLAALRRRASVRRVMNFSKRSSTWRLPKRTVTPLARSNSQAPRASRRSAVQAQPASQQPSLRARGSAAPPATPCRPGPESCASSGGMWRSSVSNSSPRVLSSPRSPQRAAAVCSTTSTSSPRGQARCTLTASTHGSVWIARRTAARSTDSRPAPCTCVLHHAFDVHRRHALEAPVHGDRLDGLIERPHHEQRRDAANAERSCTDAQCAPVDAAAAASAALGLLTAVLFAAGEHR